jgi:hypothetical protein
VLVVTGGSNAKVDCVATHLQRAGPLSMAGRNPLSSSELYRKFSIEYGGWAGRRASRTDGKFELFEAGAGEERARPGRSVAGAWPSLLTGEVNGQRADGGGAMVQ